jgi:hypothetical protein
MTVRLILRNGFLGFLSRSEMGNLPESETHLLESEAG